MHPSPSTHKGDDGFTNSHQYPNRVTPRDPNRVATGFTLATRYAHSPNLS